MLTTSRPLDTVAVKQNMSVPAHSSLEEAVRMMTRNKRGVIVTLRGRRPSGILTESDVMELLHRGVDMGSSVGRHARKTLITTRADSAAGYALSVMMDNGIGSIVITDKSNNFAGVVTQQDLLKSLQEDISGTVMRVKHIIGEERMPATVAPSDSIQGVLEVMLANKVRAVIAAEGRRPVGILTERDILGIAGSGVHLKTPVALFMTTNIITGSPDTTLMEAMKIMSDNEIRRLVITNEEGSLLALVTVRDIMKHVGGDLTHMIEAKVKQSKDIMHLLPEMLIEISDTGKDQLILWANEKVMSRFGRQIIAKPVTELIPETNWHEIYDTLSRLSKIENVKFKKDGRDYEISGFFISTEGGVEKGRSHLIIRDITEDVRLSTTDPLTSIYNRRFIDEFMGKEIERSRRKNMEFSVVIMDVDEFKKINDMHGHLTGDLVLKSFSSLILGTLRKSDVIGRYGGDEFVIIMPETCRDRADMVIERLMKEIEKMFIPLPEGLSIKMTSSYGIATYPEDGTSIDVLLMNADARLYETKKLRKCSPAGR